MKYIGVNNKAKAVSTYEVEMDSTEYGTEIFEYDTLKEAYEAVSQLALKCAELNDGYVRQFYVSEA